MPENTAVPVKKPGRQRGVPRGTAIHKIVGGVKGGLPVPQAKKRESRNRRAISGQPIYGKNRPGSHPLRGG